MVVVPTIQLALGYSRKKDAILQLETVQSQSIRTNVLPVSLIRSNKKTDFTFSFQGNAVSPIYHRLKAAGINENIGHTIDACTSRFALFSGIEVKREGGSTEEALAELAIWLCAGLESHRQLAECTAENLLPVVGWTVVGPEWRTYMAYRALNQNGVETTVYGIFA
ncbi:hypothetical protein K432DRAFT_462906 [Lepidopterella palustris CBS 459.81]|uniref:PD-(D/E)XK nuclease-like domain-containing protein n=1 Tax=Lepidopterella palustris CBS 459.81 TaxID=1314670 RepID=A0A8E2E3D9_9PEZI|nr:hypothetical protein K432DRAFT_462906 [Lepidopterella palustris CBS 459.81]